MLTRGVVVEVAVVAVLAGSATEAHPQALGAFTWQLAPLCNRVTLNVAQNGSVYTLDGFDDQCGAAQRAPLVGMATPNPDGSIGLGLTIITVPGGRPVSVDARIDLATLGGPWTDSAGNGGTLAFGGDGTGTARPAPVITPGSITASALAAGAVTGAAIANGSVGAVDVNTSEIQRRLLGACPRGQYMTSASQNGNPTCSAGSGLVVALGADAAALTTGIRNTAVGPSALAKNVEGMDNTAVGSQALSNLNPSPFSGGNTALGSASMIEATTAVGNTAVGSQSLSRLTSGASNVAIGVMALDKVIDASGNTAIGSQAAASTVGSSNIAIGANAAASVTTGSNNIHIASIGSAGDNGRIRIGTPGLQSTANLAGVRGVTTATAAIPVLVGTDGQLGTTSSSRRFKDDIVDMGDFSARLARLRPVTFRYRQALADGSRPLDYGLIAEEVAEVFPELAVRGADGQIETVAYHKLPTLLLNEVQAQQRRAASHEEELTELRRLIADLRTEIARLTAR